jgi:predicted  nucleic acid-binding Zn-ribbon protein
MSEVELSELEERLAEAQAEIERLQATAADREARAAHLEEQVAGLRRELEEARSALSTAEERAAAHQERVAGLEGELSTAREQVTLAAARYRQALLSASPEVPADMVTGESVEEVEASLAAARQTVAQIRQHLESQAQAGRVPAGAPPRQAPDLSALTPEEKIRMGLEREPGTRN